MNSYEQVRILAQKLQKDCSFYEQFPELECDPQKGIVPRALFLERRNSAGKGCILVGLNPGKAQRKEREAYVQNKKNTTVFYDPQWYDRRYHRDLRDFINKLGFNGDILWTELVKCQSKDSGVVSLQAIRQDSARHLQEELRAVPSSWLLVGVGKKAYEHLCTLFPYRTVLGIPHVSGSYVFEKLRKNISGGTIRKTILSFLKNSSGKCAYVTVKRSGIVLI